jgi:hypothetical protein
MNRAQRRAQRKGFIDKLDKAAVKWMQKQMELRPDATPEQLGKEFVAIVNARIEKKMNKAGLN